MAEANGGVVSVPVDVLNMNDQGGPDEPTMVELLPEGCDEWQTCSQLALTRKSLFGEVHLVSPL